MEFDQEWAQNWAQAEATPNLAFFLASRRCHLSSRATATALMRFSAPVSRIRPRTSVGFAHRAFSLSLVITCQRTSEQARHILYASNGHAHVLARQVQDTQLALHFGNGLNSPVGVCVCLREQCQPFQLRQRVIEIHRPLLLGSNASLQSLAGRDNLNLLMLRVRRSDSWESRK